ncbi:MAG: glycosyltransferase family 39 protein [Desulfuromonadales bacterium]|nr:glycosyltransferase family 39 protein [Desulfuromonadales bacterium]
MDQHEPASGRRETYLAALLLLVVAAVVLYVRIRLLALPLERDEGEFAYMGQLLLNGTSPYLHAYTMKLPGVSAVYALFMLLFGHTSTALHLGLLLVNTGAAFLIFLLAKRLLDTSAALYSCSAYLLLSLSQSVYGLFAHATHFVVLFALGGFLLLLRSIDERRIALLFPAGLCFGLAVTMKQHAMPLVLFAILFWLWRCRMDSTSNTGQRSSGTGIVLLAVGACVPYLLILLHSWSTGTLSTFWFWTVRYAREYVSSQTPATGLANLSTSLGIMLQVQWPFLLLAAIGAGMLLKQKKADKSTIFISGLLLFSFLAISLGLIFRRHYFILLLPALSLLVGIMTRTASGWRLRVPVAPLLIAAAAVFGIYQEQLFYFQLSPLQASRASYDENPFPEALQIAEYIKKHTSPDDRIAVLGSEPEIYFYAGRLSATGHIYMYGLMENQPYAEKMQMQLIREIEATRPKYIVDVNVAKSWLTQSSSLHKILDWKDGYLRNFYDTVGVVDIVNSATTRYTWDDKAAGYTPVSRAYVRVFKRKTGEGF